METIRSAKQIQTAERFFAKEKGKHAEMPCNLNYNEHSIFFYWAASKRVVGKTHSCEYNFYPDYYEITKNIYNEYGCFWVKTTRYEYN